MNQQLYEKYNPEKLGRHQKTTNEENVIATIKNYGFTNFKDIQQHTDLHERSVHRILSRLLDRAQIHGYQPEYGMDKETPRTHIVKGVSSLYKTSGEDGKPILQWVKTNTKQEHISQVVESIIEQMKEDIPSPIPKYSPYKELSTFSEHLLNLHVVSDYHLAMFQWQEENHDEDWNMEKAEKFLIDWFEKSLELSPDAEVGVLLNLGDFLTSDSIEPVTPTHKNVLDVDSRFQKVIRTAIRVFRKIVEMMRMKYRKVHILHVSGNHDLTSGMWFREMFSTFYENYDDVTVDTSPDMYFAYKHGDVSLFFHHGHRRNVGNVSKVFIGKFRDIFGATTKSYAHLGHRHSINIKEDETMIVEQHRTLAPADAHASGGGWISGRSSYVITYHDTLGEVIRTNIPAEMVDR